MFLPKRRGSMHMHSSLKRATVSGHAYGSVLGDQVVGVVAVEGLGVVGGGAVDQTSGTLPDAVQEGAALLVIPLRILTRALDTVFAMSNWNAAPQIHGLV